MSWGWKLASNPVGAMNFLNGAGAYQSPVSAARICATWQRDHAEFYVFCQRHPAAGPLGGWGWKLATDPQDVQHFLNGTGSYGHQIKDAQIAAFWKDSHPEFYVFYQDPGSGEQVYGHWGRKLAVGARTGTGTGIAERAADGLQGERS